MFENIGSKIKVLAQVTCWIGIISSWIYGLITIMDEKLLIGFLIAAIGSFISWISSFVTYGFGQLVENSDYLVVHNMQQKASIIKPASAAAPTPSTVKHVDHGSASEETWACKKCGTHNKREYGQCKNCGTYRS